MAGWVAWVLAASASASGDGLGAVATDRTPAGVFRMTWTGPAGLPVFVEAASVPGTWEPVHAARATGGTDRFEDPDAAPRPHRFYRLIGGRDGLDVPDGVLAPGMPVRVSAAGLDPSERVHLMFQDSRGVVTAVRAHAVTASNAVARVPAIPDPSGPGFLAGPMTLWLRRQGPDGATGILSGRPATVGPLPDPGLPPGAVALEYLTGLEALLDRAAREWEGIGAASDGAVDPAPVVVRLEALRDAVAVARGDVFRVVSGEVPRVVLGRVSGREWVLDAEGVRVLDRLIAANLSGPDLAGAGLPARMAAGGGCGDPAACVGNWFGEATGPDTRGILDAFDRFNSVAGAGVAVAAASAVVLGVASAPAAAAFAGTAGAVLFFTAYVAPAVMAAGSQAFAAPFIEARTGRIVSIEAYRPALDHVHRGATAFLVDEAQGRLLDGALALRGADEPLSARVSLVVGASRALLGEFNLADPATVGARTYARADAIRARLAGSQGGGTFSGVVTGDLTETYDDAVWRHRVVLEVTLEVAGNGTLADPYTGRLRGVGTDRISLISCTAPGGCDPGGTLDLRIDDGTVSGSLGRVAGAGTGGAGSAEFLVEFTDGVIGADGLTGVLRVDLGVDGPLERQVTLPRVSPPGGGSPAAAGGRSRGW